MEGRKTKDYNAVQRQQLERRKLRRCKLVNRLKLLPILKKIPADDVARKL